VIVNGVRIEDTFAEAFGMKATRLIITAANERWARIAAESMTGFATSVIACGCEAAIERALTPAETPDGRPGVSVLMFGMSTTELQKQLQNRVGQCVLTSTSSACYAGMDGADRLKLGSALRYFGDGHQISKRIGAKRYWRIPVMDGEFLCEDTVGITKGAVGGGNFLVLATSHAAALAATEAAVEAMRRVPNVILPFPGGIVRSGSKVGAKYKGMMASTNDAYCPTLRGSPRSALEEGIEAVLEVVIDGLTAADVGAAMRDGIRAACASEAASGVRAITAGNYGGKLGQFHFKLHEILA
jgi:formylmethanofuran--tetrahydromethanopterin N-formyltransferase